jgi:hypothetical protein
MLHLRVSEVSKCNKAWCTFLEFCMVDFHSVLLPQQSNALPKFERVYIRWSSAYLNQAVPWDGRTGTPLVNACSTEQVRMRGDYFLNGDRTQ